MQSRNVVAESSYDNRLTVWFSQGPLARVALCLGDAARAGWQGGRLGLGLADFSKSASGEALVGSLGFFYTIWCLCFFWSLSHHSLALLEFFFLWFFRPLSARRPFTSLSFPSPLSCACALWALPFHFFLYFTSSYGPC